MLGMQAKMVGRWMDREVGGVEEGLGRRCELLLGGLTVLGAVPRGKGEVGEEGGGGVDWGVEGVVGRFAGASGTMENVLEEFEGLLEGVGDGDEEVEMCMAMLRTHKHRRRLESLVGRPDSDLPQTDRAKIEHIRRQLGIARGIVDRARSIREESDFSVLLLPERSQIRLQRNPGQGIKPSPTCSSGRRFSWGCCSGQRRTTARC